MQHVDAIFPYAFSTTQTLPYVFIDFDEFTSLETLIETEDDAKIKNFPTVEINTRMLLNKKQNTFHFTRKLKSNCNIFHGIQETFSASWL